MDPNVKDQPIQAPGRYVRIAHAVRLPGPGDCQVIRLQAATVVIDRKCELSGLEKGQLDPLVAMPVQSPILIVLGIPKADRFHTRQGVPLKPPARIVTASQRLKADISGFDGPHHRPAGVGLVCFSVFFVDWRQLGHRRDPNVQNSSLSRIWLYTQTVSILKHFKALPFLSAKSALFEGLSFRVQRP